MPSLTSKKNFQYIPKPLKLTIPKLKKMYETGILEPDLRIELIYAKGKAKEVLIIDLKNETVEKYSNPSKNLFKDIHIYQKNDEINIFGNVFKLIDIL